MSYGAGQVKRIDGPNGRYYDTPAGVFPSVTHILKVCGKADPLMKWAANQEREMVMQAAAELYLDLPHTPQKLSRPGYISTLQTRLGKVKAHERQSGRAMDIGNQVHKAVEALLRAEIGQTVSYPRVDAEEAQMAIEAFQAWRAGRSDLTVKAVEQVVYHARDAHAGTMDILFSGPDGLEVWDLKTSKAIYPEYPLQTVAYAESVTAMGHGPVRAGGIIRLPKAVGQGFEARSLAELLQEREYDWDEAYRVFLSVRDVWRWLYGDKQAMAGATVTDIATEAAA